MKTQEIITIENYARELQGNENPRELIERGYYVGDNWDIYFWDTNEDQSKLTSNQWRILHDGTVQEFQTSPHDTGLKTQWTLNGSYTSKCDGEIYTLKYEPGTFISQISPGCIGLFPYQVGTDETQLIDTGHIPGRRIPGTKDDKDARNRAMITPILEVVEFVLNNNYYAYIPRAHAYHKTSPPNEQDL